MAVSFVSSASNKSTTTSVVITAPTGIQDGDILVAFVSVFRSTSATATSITSTGWTQWAEQITSTRYKCSIFWKRAASESGNYTFNSASATQMQGAIGVYRGCVATGDPRDVLSNTAYVTSGTIVRAASCTPTVANGMYVYGGWYYLAGTISLGSPSGMNARETQANTNCAIRLSDLAYTTTAASGIKDATAGAACTVKHAFMVALKPLVAVAPTVTTQAVTDITTTTATFSGTINDTGGANATERGMCFMDGQSGDPTTANNKSYETGSFGTGAYTKSLTGGTPGAYLRVRAYAINSAGTGYGTTVQMQLLSDQTAPTVVLNTPADAGSVSDTTPTLNFTGTDTQGDTVEYELQVATDNAFTASGSPALVASYAESNLSDSIQIGAANADTAGQTFTPSANGKLTSVKFKLIRYGTPTGNAYVKLYAMTGTYGTTGVPTGAVLATSDALDVSTIPLLTWTLMEINFSGANQYDLVTGTNYALSVDWTDGGDGSNYIEVANDSTTPSHGGNMYELYNGSYYPDSGKDLLFYVYAAPVGSLVVSALSVSDAGFTAGHPFASGTPIDYTVQTALAVPDTYYWRVRAKDPSGTNTFGSWSATRSFDLAIAAGYLLKYYTGATWAQKPLKYYTGSAWATKPLKVYTGTEWITVT